MFSLFNKIGANPSQAQATRPDAPSMPSTKVPQPVEEVVAPIEAVETNSFSCLNDVFGELLDDEVSYALSKW